MDTRYIYLDDESDEIIGPHIDRVRSHGNIEIKLIHPASVGMDIDKLIKIMEDFDGLILDWRLDIFKWDENDRRFLLRAASLAQELRTRATENLIRDIPIVLWSTEDKLEQSYYGDNTSQDLFDYVYKKELVSDYSSQIHGEMISLSRGYNQITEIITKDKNSLSTVLQTNTESLDIRLVDRFKNKKIPTHRYAKFILRELIERPGILIEEKLLAARLGIDVEKSSDWEKLLGLFPPESKYSGPFSDSWPRWWSNIIEKEWWKSLNKEFPPLSSLPAQERIRILREVTGFNDLVAAIPINDSYGTKFYTLCEYYQKPLDPIDGIIIEEDDPSPWQNRRYLSLDAALERLGEPQLKPHSTEIDRLRHIRDMRSQDGG